MGLSKVYMAQIVPHDELIQQHETDNIQLSMGTKIPIDLSSLP